MEPLLQNGDQVLVDTRKISVVEPGLFVLFDGDGIVCKWVERAHDWAPRKLRLKSENPRFDSYDVCDGSGCLDSFRGEYAKAGCRLKVSPSPESNSYRVVAVVR